MDDIKLKRAYDSLQGLRVGDCFGETYFYGFGSFASQDKNVESLIERQELALEPWFWTDDSQMSFSVFTVLRDFGEIEQSALAASFTERYDTGRGYGSGMHELLSRFRNGEIWHEAAPSLFEGNGSWGNGSAMRVAPVGAYFADDLPKVCAEAEKSAVVTHTHDEAIVGAIAIAVATAIAWKFKEENIRPSRAVFIDAVLPPLADSKVKTITRRARDLNPQISIQHAAAILGNGIQISCPDTVPFCLFSAGENLDNYERALWQTVSVLGDRDTTCAIVGGIVGMYCGLESIPSEWLNKCEPIPAWVKI